MTPDNYYWDTSIVYFDNIRLHSRVPEDPNIPAGDVSPQVLTEDPFVNGYDDYPFFLKQDCNLIDTGYKYVDETGLMGRSTSANWIPDSDVADIGFHYMNWGYVNAGDGNALEADLNFDDAVNFGDFAVIAGGWLTDYDVNDLTTMTEEWLRVTEPNVAIEIVGDGNNGFVEMGATGYTPGTQRIFLLADGQCVGEIMWFREGYPFMFDVSALGPGAHQLKAVSVNTNGHVTCSNLQENTFNCFLNYRSCTDAYDFNEPHPFCGYYSGTNDISVKVYDEDNNLVWSQIYSAENLCGFIPSEITTHNDLDSIAFEEAPSGGGMAASSPGTYGVVTGYLGFRFVPESINPNIRALLVMPSWRVNSFNNVDNAVIDAFDFHNVLYYELKGSQATYENLRWFAMHRNIQYIYYTGDGGYGVDPDTGKEYFGADIRRTEIGLADCRVVSAKYSDFPTGTAPSWCKHMNSACERNRRSIYSLRGFLPEQLKFVQLDCCFSGRLRLTSKNELVESAQGENGILQVPDSDMSWAFKMTGSFTCGQFCQGWWDEAWKMVGGQSSYEKFSVKEWTELKNGDSLYQALFETLQDSNILEKTLKEFRIYGGGDMTAVKIE